MSGSDSARDLFPIETKVVQCLTNNPALLLDSTEDFEMKV